MNSHLICLGKQTHLHTDEKLNDHRTEMIKEPFERGGVEKGWRGVGVAKGRGRRGLVGPLEERMV